ncbi:MAG: M48 family metallopeptidase [Pseudomonadota bacterium]
MPELKFIFLAAYAAVMLFEYSLKLMNLRHLKQRGGSVPPEFEGEIDGALLAKTRDYTVERSRFGFIESIFDSLLIILFIFGGILDRYTTWVHSFDLPFIVTGLVFFLVLSAASTIVSIPFSLYADFKIENKYGFNTMTWKLWITDFIKSQIISVVLTGIVGSASLALVQASPDFWWLFVWLFALLFGIFIMYISPYLIEPLFNKYVPVTEEGLEKGIRELMERAGMKVSKVLVVDASKRSRHTNAYFTGIGRVKRIVLYDTLIASMDRDEILAVLAHEAGHWKKKHVFKRIVAMEALLLAGIFIAHRVLCSGFLLSSFDIGTSSFFANVLLLGFAASLVLFPLTPLSSFLSRRHEREADSFACGLIARPENLASALVKLSRDNLANLYPHPFFAAFYYSHPPILQRVRRIRAIEKIHC